jgi:hypothetical protein
MLKLGGDTITHLVQKTQRVTITHLFQSLKLTDRLKDELQLRVLFVSSLIRSKVS